MEEGYFSIKRDLETVKAGGFICGACTMGKPLDDQSQDPRYCLSCFEFLTEEASRLSPERAKPSWAPVSDKATALPKRQEVVTKPITKGIVPLRVVSSPKLLGGRPRKSPREPVSRMTKWRRKKELQGVLV